MIEYDGTKNSYIGRMLQQIFQLGQNNDLTGFLHSLEIASTPAIVIRVSFKQLDQILSKKEKDFRDTIAVCENFRKARI
jgi:hypothetical protein